MNKINFVDVAAHPSGIVFVTIRRGEEYRNYDHINPELSKRMLKRGIQLLQLLQARMEKSSIAA